MLARIDPFTATEYAMVHLSNLRGLGWSTRWRSHTWEEKSEEKATRFCEAKKTKKPNTGVRHPA